MIININKPTGFTSHDVIAKLRGKLKIKRIGHAGTLDPMATGVLPVFFSNATKSIEFLENEKKEYIAKLKLGIQTDTQDITGNIINKCDKKILKSDFEKILENFRGEIKQTPPMYSAIQKNGVRLYTLARQGITIEREARNVHIYSLDLIENSGDEFTIKVLCSKGTYIRTLCNDIGLALGSFGAMSALCRTKYGVFCVEKSVDLIAFCESGEPEKYFLPIDILFKDLPKIILTPAEERKFRNGLSLTTTEPDLNKCQIISSENEILAISKIENGEIIRIKNLF